MEDKYKDERGPTALEYQAIDARVVIDVTKRTLAAHPDAHVIRGDNGRVVALCPIHDEKVCEGQFSYAPFVQRAVNAHDALVAALSRIEKWFGEFPDTGKFWENIDGTMSDRPMSYGACNGSNGERDYMRSVARAALALARGGK